MKILYDDLSTSNNDVIKIITASIVFLSSFYITRVQYVNIGIGALFILIFAYMIHTNPFKGKYMGKSLLVFISLCVILWGISNENVYIDTMIIPLLLFLNIFILLFTCYPFKTIGDFISLIGILYLLFTFRYNMWKVDHMELVSPDYTWIMWKTIVLTVLYVFSSCPKSGYNYALLIPLYAPFLFPMKEYLIHRCLQLAFGLLFAYIK